MEIPGVNKKYQVWVDKKYQVWVDKKYQAVWVDKKYQVWVCQGGGVKVEQGGVQEYRRRVEKAFTSSG